MVSSIAQVYLRDLVAGVESDFLSERHCRACQKIIDRVEGKKRKLGEMPVLIAQIPAGFIEHPTRLLGADSTETRGNWSSIVLPSTLQTLFCLFVSS